MNGAGGQITRDKSKVAASNLKGTRYEGERRGPVALPDGGSASSPGNVSVGRR